MTKPFDHKPYGSATYASLKELEANGLLRDGHLRDGAPALPLGLAVADGKPTRRLVAYDGERHQLIFGANGSGKSVRLAASAILSWGKERSAVIVDPKGQLAAITAPWRRKVSEVYVVNPFGTLADLPGYGDLASCGFNPLGGFDPQSPRFNADAGLLGEALITMEGTQPFFPRMARNLLSGVAMLEAVEARAEARAPSLGRVRDLLTHPKGLPEILGRMAMSDHRGMRNKAGPLLQEARSIRDVIAEAAAQTEFLDDDEMVADMRKPGPDWSQLKKRATTVYLILPAEMIERHTKWFRLALSAALRAVMRRREPSEVPVSFLLDEYFLIANGGLKIIENCMAYVRGFGVQLVPMLQDLNQLQDLYPKRWQTFLSNAGVVLHVGPPGDLTTSEWMSKRAGETTDVTASMSDHTGTGWSPDKQGDVHPSFNRGGGVSYGQTRVPFLPVHELLNTPEGMVHAWKQGLANTIQTEAPVYDDARLGLKGRYRSDPYYLKT
jgi:type IV secretion system protein VirD4